MKRGLYAVLFVLGFAAAGSFSAVVVAETLPTTTTSTLPTTITTGSMSTATTTVATTTTAPATTTTPTATTTTATTTTRTTTTTTTTKTTTTKPTKTTTTPTVRRAPKLVPPRVRIGGAGVGGLERARAAAAVRAAFARPLTVVVDRSRLVLVPQRFATAYVDGAVARARVARPGTNVKLVVAVRGAAVRTFTTALARRFDRAAVDAELSFPGDRPFVTRDRAGRSLDQKRVRLAIVRALERSTRVPLRFRTTLVEPSVRRAGIGPVIVINRELKRLSLYDGMKPWRTFGVATGQAVYPTPSGTFSIVVMYRDPWWYPPTTSEWARGLKPVPPGPGNPLGTRWMGLSAPGVGIHGTPDPASIGYSASHGCIRMLIPEAEWLFEHVSIGTTVHIV